jgi:hypothetical protein
MKKLLVIAIALASVNAFATRARLNALGNSVHVMDTQRIYSNPSDMFSFGDFVNLESGLTDYSAAGTADCDSITAGTQYCKGLNAEGMVVRTMGDAKYALSLGHLSDNANGTLGGLRSAISPLGKVAYQQNPIELSYAAKTASMVWGLTLVYSNYNDKKASTESKETSAGFRFGGRMGAWDFSFAQGLLNEADSKPGNAKYKGTAGTGLYAGYAMDNMYFYGDAKMVGFKTENRTTGAETSKYDRTDLKLGAAVSNKKDGNELFYGVALTNSSSKESVADSKGSSLTMPIAIGMETEATSWMTLRGSITQTVLLNDSKSETGATTNFEYSPGANNTVVAVGTGLKFNKVTVDGTLSGLSGTTAAQTLDGNGLLTQVGFTYMF